MSQFKSGLKIKINDGKEFLPDVLKLSGNGLTLDQATGEVHLDFNNLPITVQDAVKVPYSSRSVEVPNNLQVYDAASADGYLVLRLNGRLVYRHVDDDLSTWNTVTYNGANINHTYRIMYSGNGWFGLIGSGHSPYIFNPSTDIIIRLDVQNSNDNMNNICIVTSDGESSPYVTFLSINNNLNRVQLSPAIYDTYNNAADALVVPFVSSPGLPSTSFSYYDTDTYMINDQVMMIASLDSGSNDIARVLKVGHDTLDLSYITIDKTLPIFSNIPNKALIIDNEETVIVYNNSASLRETVDSVTINVADNSYEASTWSTPAKPLSGGIVYDSLYVDTSSQSLREVVLSHIEPGLFTDDLYNELKNPTVTVDIPDASASVKGLVKIGNNIVSGNDGEISVSEFTPSTDEIIELQSRTQSTLVTDNYIIQSRWDMGTIYVYSKDTRQLVTSFNGGFYPGFLHHTQRSDEIFYIGSSTINVEFVKRLRISDGQRYNLFTTLTDSNDTYYKNVLCCGMHGSTGVVISNTISGVAILSNNVRSTIDTPEVSYLNRMGYPNNLYSSGIFIEDGASYKAIFPQKMSDSDNLAIVTVTYDGSSHSYHVCNYDIPALELFSIKLINNGTDVRIVYFSNNRYHSVVSSLTSITTESYINKSGVVESTFPPTGNDGIFYNGSVRRVTKSVTGLLNEQTFNKLSTIASSSNLGIISIGNNLDINEDGIVSVPEVNLSINGSSLTVGNPGVLGQDALDTLVTHLSSAASPASNVTTITLESIYEISEPNPNLVPYGVDKSGFAVPVTASYKEKYSVIGFTKPITAARLTDIYQSITDDIYFSQYLIPLTQPLSIINDSEVFGYSTLAEVGLLPTTQLTDIRNNVSQYSTVIIGVGSYIDIIRETSPLIDIGVNTIVGEEGLFINHNLPTAGTIVSVAKISESGKISKAILSEYQHTVTTDDGDVVTMYYPTQVDTVDPTIVTVVKVFNPDFGATTHLINHTNNKDLAAQQPIPDVELITSGVLKLSSSDVNNVRAIIPNLLVGDILYVDTNSYGLTNVPGEISQPVGTFLGNSILVNIQRGIATPVGDEPIKPAIGNSGNTYVPEGLVFDTPIDNGEGSEGGGE